MSDMLTTHEKQPLLVTILPRSVNDPISGGRGPVTLFSPMDKTTSLVQFSMAPGSSPERLFRPTRYSSRLTRATYSPITTGPSNSFSSRSNSMRLVKAPTAGGSGPERLLRKRLNCSIASMTAIASVMLSPVKLLSSVSQKNTMLRMSYVTTKRIIS